MSLPRFRIHVLPQVRIDIARVYDYIAFEQYSPLAADRYVCGIHNAIGKLAWTASGLLDV